MKNTLRTAAAWALALSMTLALGACSSTEDSQSAADTSTSASATTPPEVDRSGDANFPDVTGGYGEDPEISAGSGDAPEKISVKTLVKGAGGEIQAEDTIAVNYELALWDGTKIESSFETGTPLVTPLSSLIPGWTYGLAGQHVGDRLVLVIPSEYGYGDSGSGTIPAGSTLVFVIDILNSTSAIDIDEDLLSQGVPTEETLPEGITVTGDAGTEPTVEFTDDVAIPEGDSQLTLITGAGEQAAAGDYILYQGVGTPIGDTSQAVSTWSTGTPQLIAAEAQNLVGTTVGSRVAFILGTQAQQSGSVASTTPTLIVIDVIGIMKVDGSQG